VRYGDYFVSRGLTCGFAGVFEGYEAILIFGFEL
jgi:hypothetical protein